MDNLSRALSIPRLGCGGLSAQFLGPVVVILSGSLEFLESVWLSVPDTRLVVVCLEIPRRGMTAKRVQRSLEEGQRRLQEWGLLTTRWADELCGGVTDAWHLFGIGSNLASVAPSAPPNLRRSVSHHLSGGHTQFRDQLVLKSTVPSNVTAHQRVLRHNGVVRGDGLFPTREPRCRMYCPSHYQQHHWAIRKVSLAESLRIFQVPLKFDKAVLSHFNVEHTLPFEVAFPMDLLTTMLCELWGIGGGCEPSKEAVVTSASQLTPLTKGQEVLEEPPNNKSRDGESQHVPKLSSCSLSSGSSWEPEPTLVSQLGSNASTTSTNQGFTLGKAWAHG